MKVGERGQITIPKEIRDRFGLRPNSEVDFNIENGAIVLRKRAPRLQLEKWKGHCKRSFDELGYGGVDEFIEDVRGR